MAEMRRAPGKRRRTSGLNRRRAERIEQLIGCVGANRYDTRTLGGYVKLELQKIYRGNGAKVTIVTLSGLVP
jgi:hypothetical protein